MIDELDANYRRMPGLYRLWDLPMVLQREGDWHIHYAELTEDGTPLFALYQRVRDVTGAMSWRRRMFIAPAR